MNEKILGEKKFFIHWDSQKQIVFVKATGIHHLKTAEEFADRFKEVFKEALNEKSNNSSENPIKVIVDVTELIRTEHDARRSYTSLAREIPGYGKVAVCGGSTVIGVTINFLLAPIINKGKMKIKFFKKTEDGLNWLK